jgi:hypothetical protein
MALDIGQTGPVPRLFAPPPANLGDRRIVPPDVERIDATLRFDVPAGASIGEAKIEFAAGDVDGYPALDLRQPLDWVRLDGKPIDTDDFAHVDLGAGPGTEVRVLGTGLEAGTHHVLEVGYRVDTPQAAGAQPIAWTEGGLRFDFWMSDLEPGRYLEMWVPAPLVHDHFSLHLDIELLGRGRPHALITNTADVDAQTGGGKWSVHYPAHFTALSPMLVLAPADQVEVRRSRVSLAGREQPLGLIAARHLDCEADLGACEADIQAWLAYLTVRYGRWTHGDTFCAVIWASSRGMEYDGATTCSVPALEHEVFHSWFGRGVKPARAADGWIDEAWTTWATSQRPERPRFEVAPLGLDEPPVELYPQHAWARHTPAAAYTDGSRLFAGLAHLFGGADRLRAAMAEWYQVNAGRLVTTDGLAAHLKSWSGVDISPWWRRYVHGRS